MESLNEINGFVSANCRFSFVFPSFKPHLIGSFSCHDCQIAGTKRLKPKTQCDKQPFFVCCTYRLKKGDRNKNESKEEFRVTIDNVYDTTLLWIVIGFSYLCNHNHKKTS